MAISSGSFQDSNEQESCIDCIAGQFQDATGQTGCIGCAYCAAGRKAASACIASADTGSCSDCGAGQFLGAQTYTDTSCITCPAGRSQALAGQAACEHCENGWQASSGATACTESNCPPGTADLDRDPSTPCNPCKHHVMPAKAGYMRDNMGNRAQAFLCEHGYDAANDVARPHPLCGCTVFGGPL